ncbi:transketolase family protein [Micromonospora halophytica]|uniref:Transketolase subunit B n=1 Tax=Micromonospora halophytica TaxID=47864 RepID=A0A1C5HJK8_9ACTN|nr:transketolase C-terminal domain-containing protein [Micromonospora halophytica]SCG46175.1 transketolase subunit B [Micromonospora halophytica]
MSTQVDRKMMRSVFVDTVIESLATHPKLVLLTADISSWSFDEARATYPDRVINVGIREQAMIGIAGGLALNGFRPVVHTYTPFLVERPFEQIKLDLGHQDVGAVLVSIGGSYDDLARGRTHQAPGDVALFDTVPGWTVHVPGHEDEAEKLMRDALSSTERVYLRLSDKANREAAPVLDGFSVLRRGSAGVVVAVGPVLDDVLAATSTADVTVLYAATIRPFDHAGLRAAVAEARPNVVVVEPYLRGTSAHEVAEALGDVPHRLRSHGVRRDEEVRAYGTAADHDRLHGLDVASLAESISDFVR